MKINRDYVLARLRKLKEQYGGYFGTDLLNLARELEVTLYLNIDHFGNYVFEFRISHAAEPIRNQFPLIY
jgi:hypothetical protein